MALVLAYPIFYAAYLSLPPGFAWRSCAPACFPSSASATTQQVAERSAVPAVAGQHAESSRRSRCVSRWSPAVAIAVLINQQDIWTSRITRFLILLPYAVPPIANGLIWSFIYNCKFGFLNRLLFSWAPSTGRSTGRPTPIPRCMPLRCRISGAPCPSRSCWCTPRCRASARNSTRPHRWTAPARGQRFRHITLPLMLPVIVVLLVLRTSFAFAVFDEVLAITQGGPGDATWVAAGTATRKASRRRSTSASARPRPSSWR